MKTIYKTLSSIIIAIFFFSFLSLFSEKIYEKEPALSVFNSGQNGHLKVYETLREQGYMLKVEANDLNNIAYLGSGALWVIFPQKVKYSKEDAEKIEDFVSRGGMLLIADRFGSAKNISSEFGISTFSHALVEYDSYKRRQDLPILPATIFGNDKVYSLAFKFPTAVNSFPQEAEIISKSSRISFIDADDNGKITAVDPAGPFPVAIKLKHKSGNVIYFSDYSAFTNDLIERKDNKMFFQELMASLDPDIIVFDESHSEDKILTKNINFFIFVLNSIKDYKIYIILFIFITALILTLRFFLKFKKKNRNNKYSASPTEYSDVARRILSNCGNNIYTRRWVILTGYNKIKKNILSKARRPEMNITKKYLLESSGLSGKEKNNLASLIDLGMSLERGDKKDISYGFMQETIREIEKINNYLR